MTARSTILALALLASGCSSSEGHATYPRPCPSPEVASKVAPTGGAPDEPKPQPVADQPVSPVAYSYGCRVSGKWTLQFARKTPAPKAENPAPCDKAPPDLALQMFLYPAEPEPAGYQFNAVGPPKLLGINEGDQHDPTWHAGWFKPKELGSACEGVLHLVAQQGHSVYSAEYKVRIDKGQLQGEGKWTWGRDLPDHVDTCPEGEICDCEAEMKVTGSVVAHRL